MDRIFRVVIFSLDWDFQQIHQIFKIPTQENFISIRILCTNILCFQSKIITLNRANLASGCGSVGRAVASTIKDPWFECSHRQILLH